MKKSIKEILKKHDGWTVKRGGNGHWKCRHVNGALVVMGSTPSDRRALKNFRARLRRAVR